MPVKKITPDKINVLNNGVINHLLIQIPCGNNYYVGLYKQSEVVNSTCVCDSNCSSGSDLGFINIYPNPTSDFIEVESDFDIDKCNIYSSNGSMIRTIEIYQLQMFRLSLKELPNGIYIINVLSKDKYISQKIILLR